MVKPAVVEAPGIAPQKLMDSAYIQIEKMIVTGELEPGRWVSETELVELSGYSRAPVRSAIQRLADQQLMAVYPRRGAQVCPIDYTQQFRALELRRVVERLLVASAAKRASKVQRLQFADLAAAFREAATSLDQSTMTGLDSQNFTLTLAAADNPFAAKAMTSVKGLSRRFWILHREKHGDIGEVATAYADIADAIAIGSEARAEQAVNELIDSIERFTLRVIGYSSGISEIKSG